MWRYIFTCEDIVSFLSICYHSVYHWLLYNKLYFALVTLHLALSLGWHTLCSLQMAYRSTVYFSTGTNGNNGANRQVVSARLSSVNICSLQMEHRSASFFSIGTIDSNGTNRQMVYGRPSCVNICSSQMVYQSTNYFSNGIDSNQRHQSTNRLRTALKLSSNETQFTNGIPVDWGALHSYQWCES